MPDIHHRLRVSAPPADVFRALTSEDGVGAWREALLIRVVDRQEGARIVWRCEDGPPDWIGTDIGFELQRDGDETIVRFRHGRFREANDAMADCSTAWARTLMSLKSWVETPEPEDVLVGI
jgi:uncharacterized protein YndB with AHSA1/START domain